MTLDEAIEAIHKADEVYAHVLTSSNSEGSVHYSAKFRIAKDDALTALNGKLDAGFSPNIEVSDDGRVVTLGTPKLNVLPENFSHFANNNGNF